MRGNRDVTCHADWMLRTQGQSSGNKTLRTSGQFHAAMVGTKAQGCTRYTGPCYSTLQASGLPVEIIFASSEQSIRFETSYDEFLIQASLLDNFLKHDFRPYLTCLAGYANCKNMSMILLLVATC